MDRNRVEEPVMPETGDAPVPLWLSGLAVTILVWAAYYLALSAG